MLKFLHRSFGVIWFLVSLLCFFKCNGVSLNNSQQAFRRPQFSPNNLHPLTLVIPEWPLLLFLCSYAGSQDRHSHMSLLKLKLSSIVLQEHWSHSGESILTAVRDPVPQRCLLKCFFRWYFSYFVRIFGCFSKTNLVWPEEMAQLGGCLTNRHEVLFWSEAPHKLATVAHACSPSIQEMAAVRSGV